MECAADDDGVGLFHDTRQGIPPACHSWHRMTMWAYLYPYAEHTVLWDLLNRTDPVTLGQYFWNTGATWNGPDGFRRSWCFPLWYESSKDLLNIDELL